MWIRCKLHPDVLVSLIGVPDDLQDHWQALCWEAAQYRRLHETISRHDIRDRLRKAAAHCEDVADALEAIGEVER